MMRSCRVTTSSLYKSRYVSWCADSAESPTAANTPVTAAGVSLQNHQLAGSGSVPLLLLSPPETSHEETNTRLSHQSPQQTLTDRTCPHHSQLDPCSTSTLHHSDTDRGEDDESDIGRKGKVRPPETDSRSTDDPENERFYLPRSSPVISRRHRPISWHGPDPSSSDSPPLTAGSPSLGQCGHLTISSMDDLGPKPSSCPHPVPLQEDKKQRSISISSNLNNFLLSLFNLPFSGQQGLDEGHRGRVQTICDATLRPGRSTSAPNSKDGRWSGIPEFSGDIFRTSCELEEENAHFIVVDMVLEVLESVKWTLSPGHADSAARQHTGCRTWTHRRSSGQDSDRRHRWKASRHTQSGGTGDAKHNNTHRSEVTHVYQHTHEAEEEEAEKDEAERPPKTFSVLSSDSGFEDCGADSTLTPRDSLKNAESLAQQLVMEFRRSWLPAHGPRRGRQSLRSSLQELPGTGTVVVSGGSLMDEIRLRTRMRGSLSWAPPRFQIIFTVQPAHRRSDVVALQQFLCAGCGTKVEPRYIKKLRYCEYLGRYFCDCCHSGAEAVIPGRVLSSWDFGRYPVSDFSKQLLDSVWHQPVFDLTCVGKTLYSRVKELHRFKELQEQLQSIQKLLKACRLAESVTPEFEQLPAHLLEQPHLFSMDDLLRVKKGQLVAQAREVLHAAINHVENCKLCLARGFICEFCREANVIFPFQSDICRRCPVCKACFHKHCFVEKQCPKCRRIQTRGNFKMTP
ncbi:protein associated with UVRAG as autophagy enhancer isoform X2 [Mastacembelus armatus]|uniref:protein associated with UVRAG as autophagy enhancer isoform X2 n=1 Tax=Mastacembelus armatus TaxID=205130 RepID=UPI000E461A2B|nr:protein associated with UVRAG as autophagy enhancer isoform X2 [Mastacembelus armatus]